MLVQHAGYREIRQRFGLSAKLAVRAIARACAALKVPEKMHSTFAPTSIDYDARIFSFREWDWTFSLTLLHSRQRLKTHLGERQRLLLKGRKPTAATLIKRRDGALYRHVQLSDETPEPLSTTNVMGVDLGIKHLAVTDTGETFTGEEVEAVRKRCAQHRCALQQRGSKSAKRRLRKIRMREANFRKNTNHVISKRLVALATGTCSAIALEDLEGISNRTTARRAERSRLKSWAFHQLRQCIAYKAEQAGIPIVLVDPRNTSRMCSMCRHCAKNNRRSRDEFACRSCGFALPADHNAARNIKARAGVVRPIVGLAEAGVGTQRRALTSLRL